MDNTEIFKSCKNCDYYVHHYVVENFIARKTSYGHCKKSLNKKLILCKNWTEKQEDIENKELTLKQILQNISLQLAKIALVINMDII